jgi:hypothetical protein
MDILDIHAQVLQWFFSHDLSEPDKVSLCSYHPDTTVKKQVVLVHQSVNLFVIDDPAHFMELQSYDLVTVTAELLMQDHFYLLDNNYIFKELAIGINGMGTWLHSSFAA